MTSTLPPPSTTPEITISVPLCNIDGRYDGQYGIEHWPPVPIGRRSRVKCPHEDSGHAYWKCMQNGLFSSHGPNWTHCDYWLEELDKTDIDSVDTAIDVIETITKKTYNNNTIVESEKLSKVLDIVSKVQSFVENANDSSLVVVKNYTHGVINTFSHILDQKYAWINSTSKEKTNLASKILLTTQSSSYTLSLQQNRSTKSVEISTHDFYINSFYINKFLNTSTERTNTAFGAIIRNIDGYLMANIKDNFEINSDILSFSLNNKSEIIELNNEVIITLRHKQRLELGDKVDCVFWDFQTSTWSSFGCVRDDTESHLWHTVCKCKHLTNFAALMDVNGRESKTLWLCQMSSALLLYSLLGSFFWMLMEGYYLYKSLILCFNSEFKARYLYLMGYGPPVLILIVSIITVFIKENILWEIFFDERYHYL
ncbi:unnamed protein product [Oppiella nova]|uniref:Uncharacterized protein n=1 Tax=Oppiella nova TaxID=334625 RepID=A0A7R9LJP7_9ACAR|nr:unnamed protein product [Oppiella nova]CAG2164218.1 unnamed protein product [Oppiella nova]